MPRFHVSVQTSYIRVRDICFHQNLNDFVVFSVFEIKHHVGDVCKNNAPQDTYPVFMYKSTLCSFFTKLVCHAVNATNMITY